MKRIQNISIKPYNTFGIEAKASVFIEIEKQSDYKSLLKEYREFLLLGGGSNILLTHDVSIPVVHINTKGKKRVGENRKYVWVKVEAGENWHDFVLWCLEKNYGGVENLALIPGNVGTAPIQNIGAYGVEVKEVIDEVHTIEITTAQPKTFIKSACDFGYRNSIFKTKQKDQFIITAVTFKLTKQNHKLHDSYGAIKQFIAELGETKPSIQNIAQAIIEIRTAKLPDPKKIGNSGSFFKNPIVSKADFESLIKTYPELPNYPVAHDSKRVKLAAGWLIDQCGLKGKRIGDAGVHINQALVLVNYANASGQDILDLAHLVQKEVKAKFGIELEMEVNVIS